MEKNEMNDCYVCPHCGSIMREEEYVISCKNERCNRKPRLESKTKRGLHKLYRRYKSGLSSVYLNGLNTAGIKVGKNR